MQAIPPTPAAASVPSVAHPVTGAATLVITTSHDAWLYTVGQRATFTVSAALATPYFLRLPVAAMIDGVRLSDVATVGFTVQDIDSRVTPPSDFLPFWRTAVAGARRVPLASQRTFREDLSTTSVNV